MLFMVIERFRDNDMIPVYRRLRDSGRSLPDGLEFIESWVEPNFGRCFQLMRCNDMSLLHNGGSCNGGVAAQLLKSFPSSRARKRGRSLLLTSSST
jgi:Protein of unknown function (DUF3303)